jgi:hypothetical protein
MKTIIWLQNPSTEVLKHCKVLETKRTYLSNRLTTDPEKPLIVIDFFLVEIENHDLTKIKTRSEFPWSIPTTIFPQEIPKWWETIDNVLLRLVVDNKTTAMLTPNQIHGLRSQGFGAVFLREQKQTDGVKVLHWLIFDPNVLELYLFDTFEAHENFLSTCDVVYEGVGTSNYYSKYEQAKYFALVKI